MVRTTLTERHELNLSDDPVDKRSLYAVTLENTGTQLEDVHGMIDLFVRYPDDIRAIRVMDGRGSAPLVNVEHVSDVEWEITVGEDKDSQLIEYVCYVDETRESFTENNVFLVDGYEQLPAA